MRFVGCARLLVRDVVWCRNDSVRSRLKRFRSVQFTCLIGSAAGSFSSVHSVQFTNSSGPGITNIPNNILDYPEQLEAAVKSGEWLDRKTSY